LSYAIALSHPEKISKVIALSGYLNEEIIEENYRNNDFSKNLTYFISKGVVDEGKMKTHKDNFVTVGGP
jgi:phospholipase/carboxylesterase